MTKPEASAMNGSMMNPQNSDLQVNSSTGWTEGQVRILKEMLAPRLSEGELRMFKYVCEKSGLDPFMRQIHAVKRWDPKRRRDSTTFQTGIDGYRVIAERSGEYAGSDKPIFVYQKRKKGEKINERDLRFPQVNLQSATVTVYRLVQSQRVGYTATAYWDEYAQYTCKGVLHDFWRKMPRGQLAKCAEALALRKAFPADLSGIYTFEEMQQASNPTGRSDRSDVATGSKNPVGSSVLGESSKLDESPDGAKDRVLLYTKDQIIEEIESLEERSLDSGEDREPAIMKERQTYSGNPEPSKATLPGLKNYLIFLRNKSQ